MFISYACLVLIHLLLYVFPWLSDSYSPSLNDGYLCSFLTKSCRHIHIFYFISPFTLGYAEVQHALFNISQLLGNDGLQCTTLPSGGLTKLSLMKTAAFSSVWHCRSRAQESSVGHTTPTSHRPCWPARFRDLFTSISVLRKHIIKTHKMIGTAWCTGIVGLSNV